MSKIVKTILVASLVSILAGCGGGGSVANDTNLKTERHSTEAVSTLSTTVMLVSQ